jgi:hypothetical protein
MIVGLIKLDLCIRRTFSYYIILLRWRRPSHCIDSIRFDSDFDFHFFDSDFDLDLDHIGQALWIRVGLLNHLLSLGRKV